MDVFIKELKKDYPDLRFKNGRKFAFRPPKTILLGPKEPNYKALILHEVAHALCGHKNFKIDIERIKMECEAWEKAKELAEHYGIEIDEEMIQKELDTYRDWLHQKSRCRLCGLARFQTTDGRYHCPRCNELLGQTK